MKKVIVTGVAGFIGCHLTIRLLKEGFYVIGLDNLNSYYDQKLKQDRLNFISSSDYCSEGNFEFLNFDIVSGDWERFVDIEIFGFIHLAAQAGVRYSLVDPGAYIYSNIVGFQNVIDYVNKRQIGKFLYASSSSVYGKHSDVPFSETACVNNPESLYAATKISNELVAAAYFNTFKLSSIGLRFFTVYGPWGRPDMAPIIFANCIKNSIPIDLFNYGKQKRDFTFIDDVIEAVYKLFQLEECAKAEVFNIGSEEPIELMDFVNVIEEYIGIEVKKNLIPAQIGDVVTTYSDSSKLRVFTGFSPNMNFRKGMHTFLDWYLDYYK